MQRHYSNFRDKSSHTERFISHSRIAKVPCTCSLHVTAIRYPINPAQEAMVLCPRSALLSAFVLRASLGIVHGTPALLLKETQ